MPENMMNSDHKATNQAYRDNYDQIFNKPEMYGDYYCPACGYEQSGLGAMTVDCASCGLKAKRVS